MSRGDSVWALSAAGRCSLVVVRVDCDVVQTVVFYECLELSRFWVPRVWVFVMECCDHVKPREAQSES